MEINQQFFYIVAVRWLENNRIDPEIKALKNLLSV
jgi:hypothetical protein